MNSASGQPIQVPSFEYHRNYPKFFRIGDGSFIGIVPCCEISTHGKAEDIDFAKNDSDAEETNVAVMGHEDAELVRYDDGSASDDDDAEHLTAPLPAEILYGHHGGVRFFKEVPVLFDFNIHRFYSENDIHYYGPIGKLTQRRKYLQKHFDEFDAFGNEIRPIIREGLKKPYLIDATPPFFIQLHPWHERTKMHGIFIVNPIEQERYQILKASFQQKGDTTIYAGYAYKPTATNVLPINFGLSDMLQKTDIVSGIKDDMFHAFEGVNICPPYLNSEQMLQATEYAKVVSLANLVPQTFYKLIEQPGTAEEKTSYYSIERTDPAYEYWFFVPYTMINGQLQRAQNHDGTIKILPDLCVEDHPEDAKDPLWPFDANYTLRPVDRLGNDIDEVVILTKDDVDVIRATVGGDNSPDESLQDAVLKAAGGAGEGASEGAGGAGGAASEGAGGAGEGAGGAASGVRLAGDAERDIKRKKTLFLPPATVVNEESSDDDGEGRKGGSKRQTKKHKAKHSKLKEKRKTKRKTKKVKSKAIKKTKKRKHFRNHNLIQ